jgi:hypothetical protein
MADDVEKDLPLSTKEEIAAVGKAEEEQGVVDQQSASALNDGGKAGQSKD